MNHTEVCRVSESCNRFGEWLDATMQSRGLSQADVARRIGVADVQVSRWRRGQVRPSVQYLQRVADTFGVSRATLDHIAGYPVAEGAPEVGDVVLDPEAEAEIGAYLDRYRTILQERLPPSLWRAYVEACEALASDLAASFGGALDHVQPRSGRNIGFNLND
jgi:transcriptional regulator with XRE-family HTH domain